MGLNADQNKAALVRWILDGPTVQEQRLQVLYRGSIHGNIFRQTPLDDPQIRRRLVFTFHLLLGRMNVLFLDSTPLDLSMTCKYTR